MSKPLWSIILPGGLSLLLGCAGLSHYDGRTEVVGFSNGDVRLSGILIEPVGEGPFPAVVFVHGSGPSTVDRPAWKAHANAFTKKGFAVLVYDKRGSGHSSGSLANADYADLARDVISAVKYLRTRSGIRPNAIGILGRSEGGWVGPLAASELGDIAFVVMSSGSADSPYDQTLYALSRELREKRLPDSMIARAIELRKRVWDYYRSASRDPRLATSSERDSLNNALGGFAKYELNEMPRQLAPYDSAIYAASTRMRFFDPLPVLERLNAPLLAVLGENDKSVDARSTVAKLEALRRNRDKNITIKIYPGTDHTLLSTPGVFGRYVPGYLDYIADWAASRAADTVGDIRRPVAVYVNIAAEQRGREGLARHSVGVSAEKSMSRWSRLTAQRQRKSRSDKE